MTVAVPPSHRTARELLLKSARERMDIIAAYREAGTYRGAAEITGTTHKTVRRVTARHVCGFNTRRPPVVRKPGNFRDAGFLRACGTGKEVGGPHGADRGRRRL